MYEIRIDAERSIVEVSLGGLLSTDEVASYVGELKRSIVARRRRGFAMLIDVSACPIQPQDVVRAMAEHMAAMPRSRAIAIVVGNSLSRMQVRRLFTQPYARIVEDGGDAQAWLMRDGQDG